jgi:hypothetical protein
VRMEQNYHGKILRFMHGPGSARLGSDPTAGLFDFRADVAAIFSTLIPGGGESAIQSTDPHPPGMVHGERLSSRGRGLLESH